MTKKVPVTERALYQRINRRLAKDEEVLRRGRHGKLWRSELGDYYVLSLRTNTVINFKVDIEELGRDLGALAPFEELKRQE